MPYDLGLVGLYAGLSKALRPRKAVALVKGTTGISAGQIPPPSRSPPYDSRPGSSDAFVVNNEQARGYRAHR